MTQEEEHSSIYYEEIDDFSINTEDEEEFHTIFQEESEYLFQEKVDKHYYIGMSTNIKGDNFLIMANTVSVKNFLKYPYQKIFHYLWLHSIIRISRPQIDILKLVIQPDGIYSVINKTFWLRIFQRRWKRIFREHQELLMKRKSLLFLKIREITGKFPL